MGKRRHRLRSLALRSSQRVGREHGLHLWPAALVLGSCLWAERDVLRDYALVELGAGSGLAGLVARAAGLQPVWCTDKPDLLDHLAASVARSDGVAVRGLPWGCRDRAFEGDIQRLAANARVRGLLLVGSDVFFETAVADDLCMTVAWLLRVWDSAHAAHREARAEVTSRDEGARDLHRDGDRDADGDEDRDGDEDEAVARSVGCVEDVDGAASGGGSRSVPELRTVEGPRARFWTTYHRRSVHHSLEPYLRKWGLAWRARPLPPATSVEKDGCSSPEMWDAVDFLEIWSAA